MPDTKQDKVTLIRTILVYGAGVLGSVYAGKLQQAGFDVTLLARSQRLADLLQHGLILIESKTGHLSHHNLRITDHLEPNDAYDLVLVVVRKNQIQSILPSLAANKFTPNILFLVNNASGPDELIDSLGRQRVILGFPGGGGQRKEGVVIYRLSSNNAQPTTIGELDGHVTNRIVSIKRVFQSARLPVTVCGAMDAWLKTHIALVSPIANAIYLAGGSTRRLSRTPDGLILLVRAIREGLLVLDTLNIPVTPSRYRIFKWIPEPILIAFLRVGFNTGAAELMLARHANVARDEMTHLSDEFHLLSLRSGIPTPNIDILTAFLDPAISAVPEGQSSIAVDRRHLFGLLVFMAGLGTAAFFLHRRKFGHPPTCHCID